MSLERGIIGIVLLFSGIVVLIWLSFGWAPKNPILLIVPIGLVSSGVGLVILDIAKPTLKSQKEN